MNSSASNIIKSLRESAGGQPKRLFTWVIVTILLFQGFLLFSGTYRTLVYMSDKLVAGLPSAFWWTAIDLRASAWLVVAPLLAAIIVNRRFTVWQLVLLHAGLIAIAVAVSGNVLHRMAHIQADQRQALVEAQDDSMKMNLQDDSTADSASVSNSSAALNVESASKNYDGVSFHKSYGFSYWFGEFTLVISSYLMMTAVGYAMLYFRITEFRTLQTERLRNTMVQLQLESLRNRLTPHFLFNALNTISSLTLTDGKAARTCIGQLGELLRESIEALPEGEIQLKKELEILETYLSIQKTRFGDKLDYSIDIEPGLETAQVPAFVLQPLIENSFQHGFREHQRVAQVCIAARREGADCLLEVTDNGTKLDPNLPLDEKYGLGITRQRLFLQYGGQASISYKVNQPNGLTVIVQVPYHTQNGEPK